ncbi:hypothetical protein F5876DRAFT_73302 [Lentinula aff. lateritia]|uniref:Uncharacterized protein n=1 Tax=Lentinula aff. lateritia TaxID=2804960 RepID=A0ACC1UB66_9AGAR|nr:hypothetical protein F5876DRAFT_73302 [Lentinula aff. lateritia]
MSSSESELTDLIYDELEDEGSDYTKTTRTKSLRKQAAPATDYKLQKTLKPPRATTYTARALYEQIYNSDIDLSPEYQRDVVWTKEKQTNLIDSIYRNYYIPPIIFAVSIDDDGAERRTCIDGKQRLTSIQLFMDGMIPHRDPITGQKYWYKISQSPNASEKKQQVLPDKLQTMFANKQIVCVEYSELSDLEERDIFKRVQQGMALKPSEKLGVLSTIRTVFIRDLLKNYVTDDTLGSIPWETSRGGDMRCFSHAVYCMERWSENPEEVKDHGTLAKMEKWLAGSHDISDVVKKRISDTYDAFVKLATTPKYSSPFREYKKVSPAEMVFIPLLIFVHGILPPEELRYSRWELCTEIMNMRRAVREVYDDVRMNGRVGKFLAEFIKKIEPKVLETVKPAKIKRKRIFKEENDDDKRPPATTSSSRRKLSTLDTPTISSADLNMSVPSELSNDAFTKKMKTSVPSASGLNATAPPMFSAQKAPRNYQNDSFQSRMSLSPNSSVSRSTDHDIGRSDSRGPLNGRVTLNSHSTDYRMNGMSSYQ